MKKLIVFYSLEGNTKFIAKSIAEAIKADILEIKPKKEMDAKGFMKFLWGAKQVIMKEKPELWELDKKPEDYDVLFIGTPVWASSYSAPINAFFSMANLRGKKIALFCCHGGNKGSVFLNMGRALPGNEIIGEADFREPLKKDSNISAIRAKQWAKGVLKKCAVKRRE